MRHFQYSQLTPYWFSGNQTYSSRTTVYSVSKWTRICTWWFVPWLLRIPSKWRGRVPQGRRPRMKEIILMNVVKSCESVSLFSGSLENKYARRDVSREWEGWGMLVDTWWRDLGRASPFKYSTRTSSNRLTNLTPTCLCSSPLTWLKIHSFSSMIGVHGLQTQSCDDLTGKCNGALLRTHARPWLIFCGAYARAFLTIPPSMNVHKWVLSVPCLNIWVQMIRA